MYFHLFLRAFFLCFLVVTVAAKTTSPLVGLHPRSTVKSAKKLSCISSDVALVEKEITHPVEFCNFYLSK